MVTLIVGWLYYWKWCSTWNCTWSDVFSPNPVHSAVLIRNGSALEPLY